MGTPHKFLFDRSFDAPEPPPRPGWRPSNVPPPPPPEPTFPRSEVEAIKAAALSQGREAGLAEAAQSAAQRSSTALAAIAEQIAALLAAEQRIAEAAERRAIETLRAIVQKVVPALCRSVPLGEIEALAASAMRDAMDEPRLVLRVADPLFEAVQEKLAGIVAATGFAGKVVLLADDTLGPVDARVEWAEGGAERDTARLLRDIEAVLGRAVEAISAGTSEESKNE
jgi:flagellar assembly protein FliH